MGISRRIVAGLVVNISSLVCAICMGWTSPMINTLTNPEGNPLDKALSNDQFAWIGSSMALGGILAPFIGGFFADQLGRKITLMGNSVLFIVSFLLMGFNPTWTTLLIARVLQGIAVGISMTVQAMYIGEISSDKLRGALGSFMNLFMSIGFLAINCIGPFFSYLTVQKLLLLFPCVFMTLFYFMPESPYFHVSKGNAKAAKQSLKYLANSTNENYLNMEMEKIELIVNAKVGGSSVLSDLVKCGNLKALLICGVLIACQQLTGINGVFFYATVIFEMSGVFIRAEVAVIILCTTQLLASISAPFLADKCGRKPLLLFSSALCCFFHLLFATYYWGLENQVEIVDKLPWIPLVCILGYLIAFSVGLASMPWAIISEIFPSNIKSIAAALMTSIAWISTFLVTKFYLPLSQQLGPYILYGIFAGFAGFAFIFTLLVVFETKGLSLMEVQMKLNKRR